MRVSVILPIRLRLLASLHVLRQGKSVPQEILVLEPIGLCLQCSPKVHSKRESSKAMGAVGPMDSESASTAPSKALLAPWMSQLKKSRCGGGQRKRARAARMKAQGGDDAAEPGAQAAGRRGGGDQRQAARHFVSPSSARSFLMQRAVRRDLLHGRPAPGLANTAQWLRRMQCPFVWEMGKPRESVEDLYCLLDSAPHRPTPWHAAVEQIRIACEFARLNVLWKSRELLEDVYALLQEQDEVGDKDKRQLVHKYRAALKHVLDCCCLLVRDDAHRALPLPDGTPADRFRDFDSLGDKQKACVWAMRAMMTQGSASIRFADRALQLDAGEGQWHYVRASSERLVRALKHKHNKMGAMEELRPALTDRELELYKQAYERRKSPQTVARLAWCYATGDAKDHKLCVGLVREALELFPLSAYVHLKSGHLYMSLSETGETSETEDKKLVRLAGICFSQAVHLAGNWFRAQLDYNAFIMAKVFGNLAF